MSDIMRIVAAELGLFRGNALQRGESLTYLLDPLPELGRDGLVRRTIGTEVPRFESLESDL